MKDEVVHLDIRKRSSTESIKNLMVTINHYRALGVTLFSIYQALSSQKLLEKANRSQMAFGTFKNLYYRQLRSCDNQAVYRRKSARRNSANKGELKSQRILGLSELGVGQDSSKPSEHSVEDSSEQKNFGTQKKAEELGAEEKTVPKQTLEEKLAEHQRIAATQFFM